jgi:hypothetical protein
MQRRTGSLSASDAGRLDLDGAVIPPMPSQDSELTHPSVSGQVSRPHLPAAVLCHLNAVGSELDRPQVPTSGNMPLISHSTSPCVWFITTGLLNCILVQTV